MSASIKLSEQIVFILARCFGGLSLLSVICTAQEALADWRYQLTHASEASIVTRVQVLFQIPLGILALANLFGTTAAPKSEDIWLSRGNDETCTAQGLITQFAITSGVPLDAFKSLTYLLVVKYGWEEERLGKSEIRYYSLIWCFSLVMTFYPLMHGMYGYVHGVCYLLIPTDCDASLDVECVPSPYGVGPLRLVVLVMNMAHLFFSIYVVIQIRNHALDYASRSVSKQVATKGMMYAVSVSIAQVPLAIWVFVYVVLGQEVLALTLLCTATLPLIGFFNLLVFMYNRKRMRTTFGRLVRSSLNVVEGVLLRPFSCSFLSRREESTVTVDEPADKATLPSGTISEDNLP